MVWIVRRLLKNCRNWVRCGRQVSRTCSWRSWAIPRRATPQAIKRATQREWRNEYAVEGYTRVSRRSAGGSAGGHFGNAAFLLVGAARVVGAPFRKKDALPKCGF